VNETEFAPAKVNLFLHVGSPGPDGRHPVSSLATFADVGDVVHAEPAARFSLVVEGPFAGDTGPTDDNLITRALALAAAPPMAVRLIKNLPAASGLGGGSSDAGAALRLALKLYPEIGLDRIEAAALAIGADGPLCLRARAALAEGEGEILTEAPVMPDLWAVLVNPGVPSPTGAVYRAYDAAPLRDGAARPEMPQKFQSVGEVVHFLQGCRNDLEAPAVELTPVIGEVLDWLRPRPEPAMTRMSGSGATCFALCEDEGAARSLERVVKTSHPGWWAAATCISGHQTGG
jgi:4-diphosphocytidyl-2-C-methyl-D-erythritol kinase